MHLRVRPLKRKEAGNGLAAVDRDAMNELGVSSGDYLAIDGPDGRTVARVWPGHTGDTGHGIIRIDGELRQAVGASIDDVVDVQPADVSPAETVTVALPDSLRLRGDVGSFLKDKLAGRAVREGESLAVPIGFGLLSSREGQRIPLRIAETTPEGTVAISSETAVNVSEKSPQAVSDDRDEAVSTTGVEDLPDVTYEDIGGLDTELEQVREMIELPMSHPELFGTLGIEPPKGVLLHGPPGTGKTLIAKAVANEIDAHFQTLSGPEIMSKYYGESEEQLRDIFEDAKDNQPAIIFIDEIDSIAPKRGDLKGDVERRIVAQLLSLMDGLDERGQVTVIAATNRVDDIDPALRRPGRFDREIEIGVPDADGREEILYIHTRGMPVEDEVEVRTFAERTHGFVGADLENLTKEAAMNALRRIRPDIDTEREEIDAEVLETIEVTESDFRQAMSGIEPSAMREFFVEVPDVSWQDVGGLEEAKQQLRESIQWPSEFAGAYEFVDLEPAKGVLLFGPPGSGKTLLAKAVANESEANFISIKGPELFDKYVGESEKAVREVFSKARENAPTIVFFDEIDAVATQRGAGGSDTNVSERVVSQLLTELDGLEEMEQVVVVAATNRPDLIDDALLRPGRIDRHVEVSEPDEEARRQIFSIHSKNRPLADDVSIDELAAKTDGYVGADVEAICREAATIAVTEYIESATADEDVAIEDIVLTREHFEQAIDSVDTAEDSTFRGRFTE